MKLFMLHNANNFIMLNFTIVISLYILYIINSIIYHLHILLIYFRYGF